MSLSLYILIIHNFRLQDMEFKVLSIIKYKYTAFNLGHAWFYYYYDTI